jgi:regulator of RNase E activity RraA
MISPFSMEFSVMTQTALLNRLASLDANTVSDALDFLGLPGATYGLRPLWDCPKIVGRASTIQLGPKADAQPTVHLISPVIDAVTTDDRVLVIAGGVDGISCWGDILANAARIRRIRGSVIDGLSRDIEGSESIGYPVYGRGITMISARNRDGRTDCTVWGDILTQYAGLRGISGTVVADDDGVIVIPASQAETTLMKGRVRADKEITMMQELRQGRSTLELMGLSRWRESQ